MLQKGTAQLTLDSNAQVLFKLENDSKLDHYILLTYHYINLTHTPGYALCVCV